MSTREYITLKFQNNLIKYKLTDFEKKNANKCYIIKRCKWSSKRMATVNVKNLWNNLNESYSPNKFLTYSAQTMVNCPSINFGFEFSERC